MNTDYKFTPGPWQIRKSESKQAYNVVGTKLGGKWKIARCPATVYNMPDLDEKGMIEAKANAKLISCAPDMLEALRVCADLLGASSFGQQLEKLIEKATKL